MSDIAMLVAEEYERRLNLIRNTSCGCGRGRGHGVSSEDINVDIFSGARLSSKEKNTELLNWAWAKEPKTQVAIAASTSFFSA